MGKRRKKKKLSYRDPFAKALEAAIFQQKVRINKKRVDKKNKKAYLDSDSEKED